MQKSINLYNRQQVYQLDKQTMLLDGKSSRQLMGKAARAVWYSVQDRWPETKKVVILAGCGNNGGDAFALASIIKNAGILVELIAVGDLSLQSVESRLFRESWEQQGGLTQQWTGVCPDCDLVLDGLLGIGLSRDLDKDWIAMINQINEKNVIRVSIDIPSGLNADSGIAMPVAIEADLTVTFIGRKIGCYVADGPDYCGELDFDDLGSSQITVQKEVAVGQLLEAQNIELPAKRKNNSYKNQYGHVLVIGGGEGMSGAARLAGMAALRCGTGLVSLCVHPDHVIAASQYAELMVSDWNAIDEMLKRATVIVLGPGLGQSQQAEKILNSLSSVDKPMVIDADALRPEFLNRLSTKSGVITPHPGEAARLLGITTQQIQQDRIKSLQTLNNKWSVVSVLKGAGSLVGQLNEETKLCSHGHAGMATAGMGDVLSGIIGAFLAQGLSPLNAAKTGVLVHALAAEDYAKEQDANSLLASDVIDRISLVVKNIRQQNIH